MGAFAAGFFGAMSQSMQDNKAYVREATAKKRDYLMNEGMKRRAEVANARASLLGSAESLRSLGLDESLIAAAVEQDPQEIVRLEKVLSENRAEIDSGKFDVSKIISFVGDNKPSNLSLSEAVKKVIPEFVKLNGEEKDPVKQERNLFAAAFGLDTEDQIEANVYGSDLMGGYTGADILGSLSQPLVRKSADGTPVKFNYGQFAEAPTEAEMSRMADTIQERLRGLLDSAIQHPPQDLGVEEQEAWRGNLEDLFASGDFGALETELGVNVFEGIDSRYLMNNNFLKALGFNYDTYLKPKEAEEVVRETPAPETGKQTSFKTQEEAEKTISENPDLYTPGEILTVGGEEIVFEGEEPETPLTANTAGQAFTQGLNEIVGDAAGHASNATNFLYRLPTEAVDYVAGIFGLDTPKFVTWLRGLSDAQFDDAMRMIRKGAFSE